LIAGILITLFSFPLYFAPYSMVNFSWYLLMAAIPILSILAAYGTKVITKLSGIPLIIFVILAVVAIDVYPAMTTYNWVDQPSDNFVNPPDLIGVWETIAAEPGQFRVYSAVGQTPFRYHNKFEVGTEWMGYREGALQPIRTITDNIQKNLNTQQAQQALAYFGTKYIVAPCPPERAPQRFCAFQHPGANLISNITRITKTDEAYD